MEQVSAVRDEHGSVRHISGSWTYGNFGIWQSDLRLSRSVIWARYAFSPGLGCFWDLYVISENRETPDQVAPVLRSQLFRISPFVAHSFDTRHPQPGTGNSVPKILDIADLQAYQKDISF